MRPILVVDDDPFFTSIVQAVADGIPNVTTATAGDLASALHLAADAHVVVLDLTLPDASGKIVLDVLRESTDAVFVVVSGDLDAGRWAQDRGANIVLDKLNLDPVTLEMSIQAALARYRKLHAVALGRTDRTMMGTRPAAQPA